MKRLLTTILIVTSLLGCGERSFRLADPPSALGKKADVNYLRAENGYSRVALSGIETLQKSLEKELADLKEEPIKVPVQIGEYEYFSRHEEGQPFAVFYRKRIGTSKENVVLDLNTLVLNASAPQISAFRVNTTTDQIAFTYRSSSSASFALFVKDLASGKLYSVTEGVHDFEWGKTDELFVVTEEKFHRPAKLSLFKKQSIPDQFYFERPILLETDPSYFLSLERSKSARFIFVHSESTSSAKVSAVNLERAPELVELTARLSGGRIRITDWGNQFLIAISKSPWIHRLDPGEVLESALIDSNDPKSSEGVVEWIEAFQNFAAIFLRLGSNWKLLVLERSGNVKEHPLPAPEITKYPNQIFDSNTLRFWASSPSNPRALFEYSYLSNEVFEKQSSGRKASTLPKSQLLSFVSSSGIPYTVVSATNNITAPTLITVYGAYGITDSFGYSPEWALLLKRGVNIAICHVRGGGYYGESWHQAALGVTKGRSAEDLVECAEDLINRRAMAGSKLLLHARSAGAVAAAGAINMRPDLFQAALLDVPFLDVLGSMSDKSLSLTPRELREWGDPEVPIERAAIERYSPLSGLRSNALPDVLVNVSLNDERVPYMEGVNWVSKARQLNTAHSKILLTADLDADHSGPTTESGYLKQRALQMAFLLRALPQ